MTETSVPGEVMIIAAVLVIVALVDARIRSINSFYLCLAKRWNISQYYVERAFKEFGLGKSNRYTAWSRADFLNWYNDKVARLRVESDSFYVDEIFADEEEILWPD
ncbi:MAG: hypothetical protein KBC48_01360 [Candidatus Pacebacteria bacterium]|nr:hypothetical protein [Candidatus Paceibacterota bacterium]